MDKRRGRAFKPRAVHVVKPFRPQVFLFRLLAAIFLWEGILLAFSFVKCSEPKAGESIGVLLSDRCPRLGQRAENVFEIAIATTLSLLAGGTQINLKPKKTSSDDRDASALRLPQPPSPPSPKENPPQRQGRWE